MHYLFTLINFLKFCSVCILYTIDHLDERHKKRKHLMILKGRERTVGIINQTSIGSVSEATIGAGARMGFSDRGRSAYGLF